MNTEALIGGKRFEFIQIIKNIINNKDAMLCKDECGIFAFCDIDDWKKNKITENNSKPNCIDKYSLPQEKIELFKHLFIGRTDVYAKRYYSTKQRIQKRLRVLVLDVFMWSYLTELLL